MKTKNVLLFIIFLFPFYLESVAQTIDRGPYLQLTTPQSIYIHWRTDSATDSKIWYGDSPGNLNLTVSSSTNVTDHELQITGLSANTIYYYAVGNASGQMAGGDSDHYFKTSPTSSEPINIWVLGDAGKRTTNQAAVRDAYYGFIGNEHIDMMLLLGDNAYNDGTQQEYQEAWFETTYGYPDRLINSVMWSTFGNHDGVSADSPSENGPYYDIFNFPRNGEVGGAASGTEAYYSFDYGNVHVISLNSHDIDDSEGSPMMQWLQDDVNANTKDWMIAMFHHPAYSVSGSTTSMQRNALPILEAAGVDLVLVGHNHRYERSFLIHGHYDISSTYDPNTMTIDPGDGRIDGDGAYTKNNNGEGTIYMTTGSAGSAGEGAIDHPIMYHNAGILGSVDIVVNDVQMDLKFIDSNGAIEDYFSITKITGPPSVTITNPINNDFFPDPVVINITADAIDDNGTISQVEFFIDNVSIGIDYTSPYSINWTIPTNGSFEIKAIATDNDNLSASNFVNIQVGDDPICIKVANGNDDAEEDSAGGMSITSSDLEMIQENSEQSIGIRFSNANIPPGAVINEAFIQFTSDQTDNINPCNLNIYAEASDDAQAFTSNANDISNRIKTISTVSWSPPDWLLTGEAGPNEKTVDISPLIQEVVNRPGFTVNSSIVIIIEGTGKRTAASYDGSPNGAPELCLIFSIDNTDSDGDGIPDSIDQCPGQDDNMIGTTCDDGDPCTTNDVYNNSCSCEGTYTDADGDGFCISNDPDDNDGCNPDPNSEACDPCSDLISDGFETGFGNWNSGGNDCARVSSNANSGSYSIRLRDDSGENSSLTSDPLDLINFDDNVKFEFSYFPVSMEPNEDFFLEISTDGGSNYTIYQSWVSGTDFNNETRYDVSLDINGISFSSNTVFRIRCDASGNNDQVYVDDVVVRTCNVTCTAGLECDDNDPCTINDVTDVNCGCTGIFQDSDNDGICDDQDVCAEFDDNLIGNACNDNDDCTTNDVYTTNCICEGTPASDSDGDGICDPMDSCPNLDNALIGTACDDLDACTINDVYHDDCNCYGTPEPDGDGDGICDAYDQCPGFDDNLIGTACDDLNACTTNDIYHDDCDCYGTLAEDSDNDGVCDALDVCPGFDDFLIGTTCDDYNACTINDIYHDDCNCYGSPATDIDGDGYCGNEDPDDQDPCVPDVNAPTCNTCTTETSDDFEAGFGNWNDGGNDCARVATNSNSGSYSIRLRDDSGEPASMSTNNLNLSTYNEVQIDFYYFANSMEPGEDFLLEYSLDGGNNYAQYEDWIAGTDFNNNTGYFESVTVSNIFFTANTRFRFRCDAAANNDQIYIDDIIIAGCGTNQNSIGIPGAGQNVQAVNSNTLTTTSDKLINKPLDIKVFPNPTNGILYVDTGLLYIDGIISIYNMQGKLVFQNSFEKENVGPIELDLNHFQDGIYMLHLNTSEKHFTVEKFVILK